jgi:hypothetical protein
MQICISQQLAHICISSRSRTHTHTTHKKILPPRRYMAANDADSGDGVTPHAPNNALTRRSSHRNYCDFCTKRISQKSTSTADKLTDFILRWIFFLDFSRDETRQFSLKQKVAVNFYEALRLLKLFP